MSSTPPLFVSIVIVAYNSGGLLQTCLDSLAAQTFSDFEAIIVDNASTDGSISGLRLPDARFRLLMAGENLGFAGGSNRGIKVSRAPWVATLNPDAIPALNWLAALRRATERHLNVDMFGSTQIDALNPDRLDGCGDVYSFLGMPWRGCYGHAIDDIPPEGETFAPCGAAALYRREVIEKAGGFDEAFFCYLDDVDLGFRIRLQGGICIQVPDAIVYHVGSASTGQKSQFTLYHSARNRIWLIVKNLPLSLLAALLPLHLAYTTLLLLRSRGRLHASATLAGLGAAFAGLRPMLDARRIIQRRRKMSTLQVARMLCWNPYKLWHCESDIRPVSPRSWR